MICVVNYLERCAKIFFRFIFPQMQNEKSYS